MHSETFAKGEQFHLCIEQHLQGAPAGTLNITDSIRGHWSSLEAVLGDVSDVQLMEQKVAHPMLGYCGYFDCVARYK